LFKKDYLGDLLKSNQSVLEVSENVKKAAKEAGLDVKTFYSLLKVYYFSDASSYTSESGAKGSLDRLFVFDANKRKLELSDKLKSRLEILEITLFKTVLSEK
jgi:hypothetical protein